MHRVATTLAPNQQILKADRESDFVGATDSFRPNAAICDFHNDGPTPCEEANRRSFIDSCFNVSYILPIG
jgi:hypothetical protein